MSQATLSRLMCGMNLDVAYIWVGNLERPGADTVLLQRLRVWCVRTYRWRDALNCWEQ